ncbi:MAG: hypothetical protein JW864_10140 [Spirochaetes bacterium]|nr:hypothetical protein [Spirochaetota bacterium]
MKKKENFILISMKVLFVLILAGNTIQCYSTEKKSITAKTIIPPVSFAVPLSFQNHLIINFPKEKKCQFNIDKQTNPYVFKWTVLHKPVNSSIIIRNEQTENPEIIINSEGIYVLRVNYKDGYNNSGSQHAYISTLKNIRYVRKGSKGTGINWNNALDDLPKALKRGYTYYIADGNYANHVFNDPENGAIPIIIKKALPSDHGTSTGWKNSYGDGQAVFTRWEMVKSYYIIDGQVGGGPDKWDSGYGIKVKYPHYGNSQYAVFLHGFPYGINSPGNLDFRHIDFEHIGTDLNYPGGRIFSFYFPKSKADGYKNIIISHCYLHDCSNMMISSAYVSNMLVEYCYFARNNSNKKYHGEAWQDYGSSNMVIRYNKFVDITGTAFIALKKNFGQNHINWAVFGNIFMHTADYSKGVGMGALGDTNPYKGAVTRNIHFFNNTIYNVNGFNAGVNFDNSDGTCFAYNNLFLYNKSKIKYVKAVHDYSYYYMNKKYSGFPPLSKHDYLSGTGDPCIDSKKYNFELKKPTGTGLALPYPYNYDINGNERGADGNWDIGAYEFSTK